MRTSEDALRSLKRYVSAILGDAWEVRTPDDEAAFVRPFARVQFAGPMNMMAGSQFVAEMNRPFTVLAYPPPGETIGDSVLAAARVEDAIFQGFRAGGVGGGRPLRVPLFDYAGVPNTDGSVARFGSDFMRVADLSVNSVGDPENAALWTVVVDIRLRWARTAAVVSGGKVVESVGIGPTRP